MDVSKCLICSRLNSFAVLEYEPRLNAMHQIAAMATDHLLSQIRPDLNKAQIKEFRNRLFNDLFEGEREEP
jgi:hypothetical protein